MRDLDVDLKSGNDLAGGHMGNITPPPTQQDKPEAYAATLALEANLPDVFRLCPVTRLLTSSGTKVTPLPPEARFL